MPKQTRSTFFITFRTYGSWLRGEPGWRPRGSVVGQPGAKADRKLAIRDANRLKAPRFALLPDARAAVYRALIALCDRRGWELMGQTVSELHAHVLVEADRPSSQVLGDLKAAATRALRESGFLEPDRPAWSKGGSRRQLLTQPEIDAALDYIKRH